METLYYLDLILAIVLMTLFGVGAVALYFVHKRFCQIFQKQIEIEKMQVQLQNDLKHRKDNSIFG